MKITFETETGSVYCVEKDATGQWWLHPSQNKVTDMSVPVDGSWRIQEPVIEVGEPARLVSLYFNDLSHPDRIPGGGKITSNVTKVTHEG